VEQKDAGTGGKAKKTQTKEVEAVSSTSLVVKVLSPKPGEILSGDKRSTFDCAVSGGRAPYSYRWSSNLNGHLGSSKSLSVSASQLKKGEHNIIVKVTDGSGISGEGSVLIRVM
jgi:hypothetical protein